MTTTNEAIAEITDWIDSHNTPLWAQIMKVSEEAGEAAQIYLNYSGMNPRKGKCAQQSDVVDELADVALSALVAIRMFGRVPMLSLQQRIRFVQQRINATPGAGVLGS
ncbi:MazG-like family protein [Mycobacterium sp. DL440]|uniref:MazG-like family protein n=1 Tax=Mycobacterium sp. DL440 TaxID=2675523 RepID=UPI00141F548A|nr:MazG-like family protein [Mycobacterium sp. DL440]